MCGRFNVLSDPLTRLLMELLDLSYPGPDRYNVAPTQDVHVVRVDDAGMPELVSMRWWLTPHWAKSLSTKYSMFNAKSETAAKSPAFREPYSKRRCVVPISGFYEWVGAGGRKVPYYIRPHEAHGLLLAGLWDRWENPEGHGVIESFTILTAAVHPALAFIHNRQPVMLSLADARRWLDPATATDDLTELFGPLLPMTLDVVPVSSYVNNARNGGPRCIEPLGEPVQIDRDS